MKARIMRSNNTLLNVQEEKTENVGKAILQELMAEDSLMLIKNHESTDAVDIMPTKQEKLKISKPRHTTVKTEDINKETILSQKESRYYLNFDSQLLDRKKWRARGKERNIL